MGYLLGSFWFTLPAVILPFFGYVTEMKNFHGLKKRNRRVWRFLKEALSDKNNAADATHGGRKDPGERHSTRCGTLAAARHFAQLCLHQLLRIQRRLAPDCRSKVFQNAGALLASLARLRMQACMAGAKTLVRDIAWADWCLEYHPCAGDTSGKCRESERGWKTGRD